LPAAWVILFELTLLAEDQFEAGMMERKIHSKMTLQDAKALRGVEPREPDVRKESVMSILKKQVEEQTRTIAHLEDRLSTAAGSLFDLRKDSAKDMVSVIVSEVQMGRMTRHKAIEFAKGLLAAFK
jgi:hypothetical protein